MATPAVFIRGGALNWRMANSHDNVVSMWEQRSVVATSWFKLAATQGTAVPRSAPTLPPRLPFSSAVVQFICLWQHTHGRKRHLNVTRTLSLLSTRLRRGFLHDFCRFGDFYDRSHNELQQISPTNRFSLT